ncbi:MAG: PFL family protein [Clostridiales bacterium]|nr:PFL family protein [Clostridiales bacterium]MDD7348208.1 PFL family protein [Clostridiales bacterium]MDY4059957.1 PFL family protein [Anaerovoracaceae bacterium]
MLNMTDIMETITMIQDEKLDIRTITMGISLLDCADTDIDKSCEKIYNKILTKAKKLVPVGESIEKKYGIPIVNKRISVTPISMLLAISGGNPVKYAQTLDKAAKAIGVNFVGGYSALVQKGFASGDRELIESIPEALAETEFVCSSVNVGSTRAGINMDAVALMGNKIVETAKSTADRQCIGAAKLVVFCNAVEDNPFMAGAFHGVGEADCVLSVGVSGPGVVRSALSKMNSAEKDNFQIATMNEVAELIKKTAFKITRMGQLVGSEAADTLGVPFGIVDLSLAPTPAVGDSVAHILEEIGLEECGTHGTTAALAMLNDAVKKGGVMASSSVGGLSGAFIPVTEDAGMISAARSGTLTIEKLEAMTAVCSVGLDMIVVPGDTTPETISAIIADEAAIGMVNSKTTAVRLIPAIGLSDKDELNFGGLLGSGPVMKLHTKSSEKMIRRGGRIPAPLQSLKN